MRTYLPLLVLCLLSFLPEARAQAPAMRPPPVRPPPVMTPGYFPGTPPEPVHTPTGAGASHGALVPATKQVPRSPNKRLLPPTKEPGLWAVDGAPVASSGKAQVFGVDIPAGASGADATLTRECADDLSAILKSDPAREAYFMGLPKDVRECLAAMAFRYCASTTSEALLAGAIKHPTLRPIDGMATAQRAETIKTAYCAGVRVDSYFDFLGWVNVTWRERYLWMK